MHIRPFHPTDQEAVVVLWRSCDLIRPWNDPFKDIRRKLAVRPDLFLVGELDGEIIACVIAGYEGHRGWLNYLAVSPKHQRRGYARAIVDEAERLLRQAGCPKINLQVRTSNHGVIEFYRRLGYTVDDVVSMGKRLEHDDRVAEQAGCTEPAMTSQLQIPITGAGSVIRSVRRKNEKHRRRNFRWSRAGRGRPRLELFWRTRT